MPRIVWRGHNNQKQEAFEKCWAHSPLRTAARPNFTLPFTRCRYCRTPPALRYPRQRRRQQQRQRVTDGTAMAPWNGPITSLCRPLYATLKSTRLSRLCCPTLPDDMWTISWWTVTVRRCLCRVPSSVTCTAVSLRRSTATKAFASRRARTTAVSAPSIRSFSRSLLSRLAAAPLSFCRSTR